MVQYPDANHPRFGTESRTVRASGLEPSTLSLNITDGSILQDRTFHVNASYHGWFRDLTTFFIRIKATTDRQAGLTQSPAQPCRIVAAGDALEATEKGPHNLRI